MRHINDDGLATIRRFEGLRTKAYKCPAGVWTIGYGHTSAAGAPKVDAGTVVSTLQAEEILKKDLEKFEGAVTRLVKVPLTANQFAALVSFVYNVGEGAFAKSTLLKKLNKAEYDAVPGELAKWVKAGGRTLTGLVNRRAAEAGLWAKGAFVSSRETAPAAPVSGIRSFLRGQW
jgi:lysozyme